MGKQKTTTAKFAILSASLSFVSAVLGILAFGLPYWINFDDVIIVSISGSSSNVRMKFHYGFWRFCNDVSTSIQALNSCGTVKSHTDLEQLSICLVMLSIILSVNAFINTCLFLCLMKDEKLCLYVSAMSGIISGLMMAAADLNYGLQNPKAKITALYTLPFSVANLSISFWLSIGSCILVSSAAVFTVIALYYYRIKSDIDDVSITPTEDVYYVHEKVLPDDTLSFLCSEGVFDGLPYKPDVHHVFHDKCFDSDEYSTDDDDSELPLVFNKKERHPLDNEDENNLFKKSNKSDVSNHATMPSKDVVGSEVWSHVEQNSTSTFIPHDLHKSASCMSNMCKCNNRVLNKTARHETCSRKASLQGPKHYCELLYPAVQEGTCNIREIVTERLSSAEKKMGSFRDAGTSQGLSPSIVLTVRPSFEPPNGETFSSHTTRNLDSKDILPTVSSNVPRSMKVKHTDDTLTSDEVTRQRLISTFKKSDDIVLERTISKSKTLDDVARLRAFDTNMILHSMKESSSFISEYPESFSFRPQPHSKVITRGQSTTKLVENAGCKRGAETNFAVESNRYYAKSVISDTEPTYFDEEGSKDFHKTINAKPISMSENSKEKRKTIKVEINTNQIFESLDQTDTNGDSKPIEDEKTLDRNLSSDHNTKKQDKERKQISIKSNLTAPEPPIIKHAFLNDIKNEDRSGSIKPNSAYVDISQQTKYPARPTSIPDTYHPFASLDNAPQPVSQPHIKSCNILSNKELVQKVAYKQLEQRYHGQISRMNSTEKQDIFKKHSKVHAETSAIKSISGSMPSPIKSTKRRSSSSPKSARPSHSRVDPSPTRARSSNSRLDVSPSRAPSSNSQRTRVDLSSSSNKRNQVRHIKHDEGP